jgi:hypothetical protein
MEMKDIKGYEGYYKISEDGVVKSYDRYVNIMRGFKRLMKGRVMRPYIGRDGYYYYLLTVNKKSNHIALHRLLAIAFLPNPENKREVNHINGDRLDNKLSNLEWVTPKENIQHSIRIGTNTQCLPGERNPMSKLKPDQVIKIRSMTGSHQNIAKVFGVSRRTIGLIKSRVRWAHL